MQGSLQTNLNNADSFCKIGIDDFISGTELQCNLYIRFSGNSFVKIARQGEPVSLTRLRSYKSKGLKFLYIQHDDFRRYVHFNIALANAVCKNSAIQQEKKLNLIRHTGEILLDIVHHDGLDHEIVEDSLAFVESAVDILSDDPDLMDLLETLNSHPSSLYAHSVGVSFYSVLLAHKIGWNLPSNRFKLALGGLFHDIGEKEMTELLRRPRAKWSDSEVRIFESHSNRGLEILRSFPALSEEVLRIVKEHHEDCLAHGFPQGLKKSYIHPMARLIAVADEFCYRVINNLDYERVPPQEALRRMVLYCSERLDPEFFKALMQIFDYTPVKMQGTNGKSRH